MLRFSFFFVVWFAGKCLLLFSVPWINCCRMASEPASCYLGDFFGFVLFYIFHPEDGLLQRWKCTDDMSHQAEFVFLFKQAFGGATGLAACTLSER